MDKRQYFIEALQRGVYKRKAWTVSVFTVTRTKGVTETYDYQLITPEGQPTKRGFIDPETKELILLDGEFDKVPVFKVRDKLVLNPGDLANVKAQVETTYGNAFVNMMLLVYPFGDRIPYQEGKIKGKTLDKLVASMLIRDPEEGQPIPQGKVTVSQMLEYCEALSALGGLSSLFVPAASAKTLTVDPSILKRRDELLLKHKDQLHDPAIVAGIEKELVAMDKATFKGDPAEGFLTTDKLYAISRKRVFIVHGIERGFAGTGKSEFIPNSLNEGWDITKLPAMVDSLRAGTYDRGKETALGGESVKFFYRVFQNTKIIEKDCKAKNGIMRTIYDNDKHRYVGLYVIDKTSRDVVELTPENISKYVGKTVEVRTTMLCKTLKPSFCEVCIGKALSLSPKGVHIAASDVGSQFMMIFMASMHGKILSTARYDPSVSIS